MDSNFQVKVTADLTEFYKSIQLAANALTKLDGVVRDVGKAADYAGNSIGFKLGTATDDVAKKATKATQEINAAANSVNKFGIEAGRGRLIAFAFGQVIRDAGFFSQSFGLGLLAISNNIPMLIDQIANGVAVLQPFAGALSLVGSILTAGLTIWAYSSQATKTHTQSIEEWRKSLDDVTESQLKGKQAALDEVTTLGILYRATTNLSNSYKTRLEAAKQLQDEYPKTFGNMNTEAIMAGKAANAYNNLTNSIIEAAMAEAAKNKIVENASRILDNNTKILEAKIALSKLDLAIAKERQNTKENVPGATGGYYEKSVSNEYKILDLLDQRKALVQTINNAATDTNILTGRQSALMTEVDTKAASFVSNLSKGKKESQDTESIWDKLNRIFAKTRDQFDNGGKLLDFDQQRQDVIEFTELIDGMIDKARGIVATNDMITESAPVNYVPFDLAGAKKKYEDAKKQAEDFKKTVEGMFVGGFSNIGSAIGDALGSGGNAFDAFANAVLASIGGILVQFGELTLAAGVAATALGKALKNPLNPKNAALAIAAGVALIAVGAMVKSFSSKTSGGGGGDTGGGGGGSSESYGSVRPFASGGIISGPTNALMGEYPGAKSNPEVVAPLDKLQGIIAGSIGAMGGGGGGVLESRISGNDLVILLDRSKKNRQNYF